MTVVNFYYMQIKMQFDKYVWYILYSFPITMQKKKIIRQLIFH